MWYRAWWFKRRLRRERRWNEFLASLVPPAPTAPAPTSPDIAGAALAGAAQLIGAFTDAEIKRLEATAADREAERAERQAIREGARKARREALERRGRDPRGRVLPARANGDARYCKVCHGETQLTPEDVDRHYSEGHATVPVQQ